MTKLDESDKVALDEVVRNLAHSSALLAEAARLLTVSSLRVLGLPAEAVTTEEAVTKLAATAKEVIPLRRDGLQLAKVLSQHAATVSQAAPDIAAAAPNFAVAAYPS